MNHIRCTRYLIRCRIISCTNPPSTKFPVFSIFLSARVRVHTMHPDESGGAQPSCVHSTRFSTFNQRRRTMRYIGGLTAAVAFLALAAQTGAEPTIESAPPAQPQLIKSQKIEADAE